MEVQKTGPFEVDGENSPAGGCGTMNPNGKPNSVVLRPWWNGIDVTRTIA